MSKRCKAGDRVRLIAGAGMCGDSAGLIVTIQPEEAKYEAPCMLSCGDPECREWIDVWTDPDPNGKQYPLYHVSECQMRNLDEDESER